MIGFGHIMTGIIFLLMASGRLKVTWKTEAEGIKKKRILKYSGTALVVLGIVRVGLWIWQGN